MQKRGSEEKAWDLHQGRAILSLGVQETRGNPQGDPRRRVSWRRCLPRSAVEMEGAPCTWLWREMPVCSRNATRGGKDYSWAVYPRGGRLLVGGGGNPARWRPRGWASPGLGEGMAGFARGMDGTRALQPPGGSQHPRRRREGALIPGGGRWLPVDYSWQGAGSCLGSRQLGGGVGTARRGGRVSRREPWGRAPGARAVGAARLGACRDAACGGPGCRKQQPGTPRLRETRVG